MAIDYYEILQIAPSATLAEIKSAYRKLAQQYHPDKNPGDQYATTNFYLIKQAYEVLIDPYKKEKYLQKRWLAKINNETFEKPVLTPEHILRETLSAGEKVHRMDIFRLNVEGIKSVIDGLISQENIDILSHFNELSINNAIVGELLKIIQVLPSADQLLYLHKLSSINHSFGESILERETELGNKVFWETWKPAFILLIVVFLCILIWGTSMNR